MTLIDRFIAVLGSRYVLQGGDAQPFLSDWRGRYQGQALCVLRPGNRDEVAAVVALCAEQRVAMVPQGGNTSLCGAATPDGSGQAVVISLSRLNRVLAIDCDNDTITVEAGCKLATAQEAAAAAGRLLPLSLASSGSCEIGGNLSTNAGGVQVLRYGNARDLTLGLQVVLADGQCWDGLRGLRKDNTGYDLKQLFIGAEGTLGIITAAVLKLFPLPSAVFTAWLAVPDPAAALILLNAAKQRFGARVTAFELVSRPALDMVLRHIPGAGEPLTVAHDWYVLLEFSDQGDDGELRQAGEAFVAAQMTTSGPVSDGVIASNGEQAKRLWALRENISEAQKSEGISIKHDVAVPVSRIPEFLTRAGAKLAAAFPDVRVVAFGHVGDGNLHYNLSKVASADNAAFIAATSAVNLLVHDLVAELGGSISAEHGLGQLKREEILRYKSPLEMAMMSSIKAALDPLGLMNPGKVL